MKHGTTQTTIGSAIIGATLSFQAPSLSASTISFLQKSSEIPAEASAYVRDLTQWAPQNTSITGTWHLSVHDIDGAQTIKDITLEIAPVNDCIGTHAVYYNDGAEIGVEPGVAIGAVAFRMILGGVTYVAIFSTDGDGKLVGTLASKASNQTFQAEALRIGDSAEFTLVPVTASMNAMPIEQTIDGVKSVFIREPGVTNTAGVAVFHSGSHEYFVCYDTGHNGRKLINYAYSRDSGFVLNTTDLGTPKPRVLMNVLTAAKVTYQKRPFLISFLTTDGFNVDFVSRPVASAAAQ